MVGEGRETNVRVNIFGTFYFSFLVKEYTKYKRFPFSVITEYVMSVHQEEGNLKSLGLDGCRVYVKYSVQ